MVYKRKSSEVGKSTSELVNHTSKSNFFAQIDLKLNNADVENQKTEPLSFPKHQKLLKSVEKTIQEALQKYHALEGGSLRIGSILNYGLKYFSRIPKML